jgi:hypothetical protein
LKAWILRRDDADLAVTLNAMVFPKIGRAVFCFAEVRIGTSAIRADIDANKRAS